MVLTQNDIEKATFEELKEWTYLLTEGYKNNWNPTIDYNDAFELVKILELQGYRFTLNDNEASFVCSHGPCKDHGTTHHNYHGSHHDSESKLTSICRSALLVHHKIWTIT